MSIRNNRQSDLVGLTLLPPTIRHKEQCFPEQLTKCRKVLNVAPYPALLPVGKSRPFRPLPKVTVLGQLLPNNGSVVHIRNPVKTVNVVFPAGVVVCLPPTALLGPSLPLGSRLQYLPSLPLTKVIILLIEPSQQLKLVVEGLVTLATTGTGLHNLNNRQRQQVCKKCVLPPKRVSLPLLTKLVILLPRGTMRVQVTNLPVRCTRPQRS